MGHYFLSEPPAPLSPGDRFTVSRYGTVNHIARTVAPSRREPGQALIAWCGMSGNVPDRYRDDHSSRAENPKKPLCKNCRWRAS